MMSSILLRYLGGGAVVLALVLWFRGHYIEVGRAKLRPELAAAQSYARQLADANASQRTSVDQLMAGNALWVWITEANAETAAIAGRQAAEWRAELIAAQRPRDTADACLALEATPMSVCPVRKGQLDGVLQ
jgi:hypothetical protein